MIDTTRLLRSSPFGEWVNVFYDPKQTDIETLVQLMRTGGCSGASHVEDTSGLVLNPYIAPGDPIQLNAGEIKDQELSPGSQLPSGWELAASSDGSDVLTLATTSSTPKGSTNFVLEFKSGETIEAEVAVVRQVGRH